MAPERARELLSRLGVGPSDLQQIQALPYAMAVERLDELKARVRREWKRLAFELHPDRTGGDPEKTADFRDLTSLRDEVERLQVRPPAPPPMPVSVSFTQRFVPSYATRPFSTSASTTPTFSVWHVVRMRP